uniref:Putative secreted protein n=1 Tax=Ixodes ricinus TaxID=34613 RepID=A0A6B0U165_IXORI
MEVRDVFVVPFASLLAVPASEATAPNLSMRTFRRALSESGMLNFLARSSTESALPAALMAPPVPFVSAPACPDMVTFALDFLPASGVLGS